MTNMAAPDKALVARAAEWDARLRSPHCTDEERAAFRAWCAEDPNHLATFETLQAAVGALRAAEYRPELRALRDAARSHRGEMGRRIGAAAAVLFVAGLIALPTLSDRLNREHGPPELEVAEAGTSLKYATAVGQRSGITLEDGSVITLNTDSAVDVAYDEARRQITLLRGQALFEVAKDPERPFVVTAGDQQVIALGTTFDVRLNGDEVEVTLVEGSVEVAGAQAGSIKAPPQPVRLAVGERLVLAAVDAPPQVTRIDTEKATLWRDGYVTFDDTLLTDAIQEMNRYSTTRIVADDPALAELKVNGMFRSGHQTRFTEALEEYFPIEARREGNVIVLKMSHPG